jgi:hypothetical protein
VSTVGLAPKLVEDGPLPIPPKYRLLDVAQQLPEGDPHWQAGVSIWSYPPDLPSLWSTCDHGTFSKNEGEEIPNPQFDPFTVYMPVTCTTRALGGDTDELRMRAVAALDASVSYGVEQEVSQGIANPLSPYFSDANVTILGAAAVYTVAEGLAALEDAIGQTGKSGVIHVTPAVATRFSDHYLFEERAGILKTALGTPVVVSGGYKGADPSGGANPPTAGSPGVGTEYAFATGPLRYIMSEAVVVAGSVRESLDRSNNLITFRAERHFVVFWDTVLQVAALIGTS